MTYKQANSIRELVYQLSKTWRHDPLVCALEGDSELKDSWSCHLYTAKGRAGYKSELWAIALAIEKAGCGISVTESTYNRGTTKPEIVDTIKIK